MTNPDQRNESEPAKKTGEPDTAPFSVADRWWWSGTFRTVLGVVIAYLQWTPISDGVANWMNWAMVVIGAAVAIWGVSVLARDYSKHSSDGDAT